MPLRNTPLNDASRYVSDTPARLVTRESRERSADKPVKAESIEIG